MSIFCGMQKSLLGFLLFNDGKRADIKGSQFGDACRRAKAQLDARRSRHLWRSGYALEMLGIDDIKLGDGDARRIKKNLLGVGQSLALESQDQARSRAARPEEGPHAIRATPLVVPPRTATRLTSERMLKWRVGENEQASDDHEFRRLGVRLVVRPSGHLFQTQQGKVRHYGPLPHARMSSHTLALRTKSIGRAPGEMSFFSGLIPSW